MSKKNNALFTISPVSEEFLNIFKSHFNLKDDNLSLIDLSTLRRLSIKDLLKTLRSFKFKSLYIVYEEERAKSLFPHDSCNAIWRLGCRSIRGNKSNRKRSRIILQYA